MMNESILIETGKGTNKFLTPRDGSITPLNLAILKPVHKGMVRHVMVVAVNIKAMTSDEAGSKIKLDEMVLASSK